MEAGGRWQLESTGRLFELRPRRWREQVVARQLVIFIQTPLACSPIGPVLSNLERQSYANSHSRHAPCLFIPSTDWHQIKVVWMFTGDEVEEKLNGSRSIFRCKNGRQVQALIFFFRDISIKCAPPAVHSKSRKSFFLIRKLLSLFRRLLLSFQLQSQSLFNYFGLSRCFLPKLHHKILLMILYQLLPLNLRC